MLNMKYIKYLLLALMPLAVFGQNTPINNPILTGNISIPAVTNNLTYVNSSHNLVTLGLGSGLTLSGGVLTTNNSGGGSGVSQIIAGAGISISPSGGTGIVTINSTGGSGGGINSVSGTVNQVYATTTNGNVVLTTPQAISATSNVQFNAIGVGGGIGYNSAISIDGTINSTNVGGSNGINIIPNLQITGTDYYANGIAINPSLSTSSWTGASLSYQGILLYTPSIVGTNHFTVSSQLFINQAPSASNATYGIWQNGTDQNLFGGSITTTSSLTGTGITSTGSVGTGLYINNSSSVAGPGYPYGILDKPTFTFPSGYNNYSVTSELINPSVVLNSTGNLYFGINLGPVNISSGSGNFGGAYQLYIASAPSTTSNSHYGIFQAGTDANYFNGNITTPNLTLTSGGGGKITFADGTTQSTAATGGGGGSVSISAGTGISVSPSPITGTGSVSLSSAYAGYGIGNVNGIAKGNGSGTITAALAGTDYTSPTGSENLSNKTITGSNINSTNVGSSSPATGAFTTLSASGTVNFTGSVINASGGYINLTSPTGSPSTSGQGQLGAYPTFGLELIGNGTTSDIVLLNRVGGTALSVPANTTLIKLSVYTVSTLPSPSGNAAAECFVSDSNAPNGTGYGTTVVGGGGYLRKVFCDGYNWILE